MAAPVASQVVCMFLLLLGTLGSGILPVYVKNTLFRCSCEGGECEPKCRAKRGKAVTAFLIYFGGGVLLGTCLLHLLPESREGFEEDHGAHNETEGGDEHHETFPIPEFICSCGFFAVYLFEEIIHFFLGGHTHVPPENKAIRSFSRSNSCSLPRPSDAGIYGAPRSSDAGIYGAPRSSDAGVYGTPPPTVVVEDSRPPFSITNLLTVAALSFHSLFEGLAVGLQRDATSTWLVFLAIAVHKYVIAFVVGLEVLASGGRNLHVYVYMAIFSLMSPLGMAVAMITQSSEDSLGLTVSVLNGIATGTLLYVTFFEILQRSEHKDVSTWIQLVATVSGFALTALMQLASTYV